MTANNPGGRPQPVPRDNRTRAQRAAPLALVILLVIACVHLTRTTELTRDRAIAIAKAQVRFEPFDVYLLR